MGIFQPVLPSPPPLRASWRVADHGQPGLLANSTGLDPLLENRSVEKCSAQEEPVEKERSSCLRNLFGNVDHRRCVLMEPFSGFELQFPKCLRGDYKLAALFPACECATNRATDIWRSKLEMHRLTSIILCIWSSNLLNLLCSSRPATGGVI